MTRRIIARHALGEGVLRSTPGSLLLFGARPPMFTKWWAYKKLVDAHIPDDGGSSIFTKLLGCVIENRASKIVHGNEITVIVTWVAAPDLSEGTTARPDRFAQVGDMFSFSTAAWQCATELVEAT